MQESSTPRRPDQRCWQPRGTPSPALGPVGSESTVTRSPKASCEAHGTPDEVAAYKWVGKIKAGPTERREGDRECLWVLGMGVEFLSRTPECQGNRHTCECWVRGGW